jgi:hypothetical protein
MRRPAAQRGGGAIVLMSARGGWLDSRGCPFRHAAAEALTGKAQQLAIEEYRELLCRLFRQLASDTGASDSEALIVLDDGASRAVHLGSRARLQLGLIRAEVNCRICYPDKEDCT